MPEQKLCLANARVVNEGEIFAADIIINGEIIEDILRHDSSEYTAFRNSREKTNYKIEDIKFKYLIPGLIDGQVHFRDPGLTEKGDLYTESRAAVAGGITSFMEMPNTNPRALTIDLLEDKYELASKKSLANYSFYMGTSNDNIEEVIKVDPKNVCGIKVFMGASTGNMLVDDNDTLAQLFAKAPTLIATHCEEEAIIRKNTELFINRHGEDLAISYHPLIRNHEACFQSSDKAVKLAKKYGTRLHVLHISTADELALFDKGKIENKRITAEVCVHHLWFTDKDYAKRGGFIKWNPAVKTQGDRDALRQALLDDQLDIIATDHAPHTLAEKNNSLFQCPSGGPSVQHSLNIVLELYYQDKITLPKAIDKLCHAPAKCFKVEDRGYIRKGYKADIAIFEFGKDIQNTVDRSNILYKCGWAPYEGQVFHSRVLQTYVNGNLVYDNGKFNEENRGQRLTFSR